MGVYVRIALMAPQEQTVSVVNLITTGIQIETLATEMPVFPVIVIQRVALMVAAVIKQMEDVFVKKMLEESVVTSASQDSIF